MFTIGKLATEAEVSVETIRYYQRKNLLEVPKQNAGFRKYSEHDLRRLKFIKEAQKAGFTLNEIKELLELDTSHDHQRAQQLAIVRIDELEQKISQMQQARDRLLRLSKQCESAGANKPCAILAAFEV